MIVAMHVATGALAGSRIGSPSRAAMLGLALHGLGDAIPHHDVHSRRFEIWSGIALLVSLAAARGPLDPAVVGAAACAAPDLEHVLPLPRPGGRALYPTHRFKSWHREGGVSAGVQLTLAGVIVGALVLRRKERLRCHLSRSSCTTVE